MTAELVMSGGARGTYTGTVNSDPTIVGKRMRSILDDAGVKKGARGLGLKIDGEPTADELAEFAAADGAVIIEFESA